MKNNSGLALAEIDVLILCGGLGTRLRPIMADRQKVMAPVGGKPFLEIVVGDLLQQGFRRIIFLVGHMKEQIIERYSDGSEAEYLFSEEDVPLGTGGAIQKALSLVRSNTFLTINGDSCCPISFCEFYRFHLSKSAALSLVVATVSDREDVGTILLNDSNQIHSFTEKSKVSNNASFINAGIYLMQLDAIDLKQMNPPFSLEYDVLPKLVIEKPSFGFITNSLLVDIGTPARYLKAEEQYRD
jgi:NDP-sugar pyrophosphorylase family protein